MDKDINSLRGYNPATQAAGLFLKLNDGDSVKVRLFSLPVIFSNSFEDPKTGEVKVDTRFAFIVWNHEIAKAQIWVTNGATYGQQISPLLDDDEYGDWREYDVKISRTGEKAQTRYSVRPGVKRYKLGADETNACTKVDIIAKIEAGKGASQVMWLSDYRELEESQKHMKADKQNLGEAGLDSVDNDVDETTEVNLDNVPF